VFAISASTWMPLGRY